MITQDKEKGIALLFSLGILSLLLILAVSFTATCLVEVKNAENNAFRASARMLAESTINKVAGLMQSYDNVLCSYTASGSNQGHSDWIYKLGTDEIFTWDNSYASSINWEYLIASDGTNNKIIGRYAYVVMPGGGVDPGTLIKAGVDEATLDVEQRPGVEMNEINIRAIDPTYITGAIAGKMNYTGTGSGLFTGNWLSFNNMFSVLGLGASHANVRNLFRDVFVIDAVQEPECFWLDEPSSTVGTTPGVIDVDLSNDSVNELYHRFNLARTGASVPNWNTITVNNILGISPAFPSASDEFDRSDPNYDGYCIPWISNWTDLSGGWSNAQTKAKQIAANIIDYCDYAGASSPYNEKATSDWGGDEAVPPTYVGNDLVPYINEIQVRLAAMPIAYNAGTDTYSWGNGDMRFKIEIHNMYTETLKLPSLKIRYHATINVKVGGIVRGTKTMGPATLTPSFAAGDLAGNSYKISNITSASVTFNMPAPKSVTGLGPGLSKEVEAIIHDLKIYVTPAGGAANDIQDYAFICNNYLIDNIETPPGPGAFRHKFFRINDPRHNQFPTLWIASDSGSLDVNSYLTGGTNPECRPALSGDEDNIGGGDEARDISTGYIRNAPMQSPWELGTIHRAANWETINLKTFNTTVGSNKTGGGGSYATGDANILDQIKISSANTSPKKLPIKTQEKKILTALFRNIVVDNTYANPGATSITKKVRAGEAEALATEVLKSNASFVNRGALASVTALSSSSFQNYGTAGISLNKDSMKEEIIGKTVNLTTAYQSDYFSVIVMAQSIKDIGGGVSINKDINFDGQIATFTESGRDLDGDNFTNTPNISETISNCQFGIYDRFADAILSTQKMSAQIYRNPATKKCKIIRKEFFD